MNKAYLHLTICFFCYLPAKADVYVVIYATVDGKTGHAGIAVDRYEVHVVEEVINNHTIVRLDSVKTGQLIYYDFWPKDDAISRETTSKEVEGQYFKLPQGSSEREITVESLCSRGIPHKEGYPSDGLLRIRTNPTRDYELRAYLDGIIAMNRPFDTQRYNCADFVLQAVEFVVGLKLDAKEFIPFQFSTTPNRLYKAVRALQSVEVVKNADDKTNGSFWQVRVLPELAPISERR